MILKARKMIKKNILVFGAALMLAFAATGCAKTAKEPMPESIAAEQSRVPAEGEAPAEKEVQTESEAKPEVEVQEESEAKPEVEAQEESEAKPEKEVQAEVRRPYEGKKVSFCGDSISTFTGYIPENYSKFYPEDGDIKTVEDTWWMQVVERTGMTLCSNASFSGSTVSGQSQDNHEGKYSCGNQRIADLTGEEGSLPDVIIILMGANDLLNHIPLGGYDGVSAVPEGNIETFSEAYALMLDKMKMWYPDAEIYCCTIAEVSRWNENGEKFPFMNAHSLTAKDYNAWITAIAQAKGVKLIDVYSCGLTFENAKENTSDGTHPNAAGAKLIADKVCEAFQ